MSAEEYLERGTISQSFLARMNVCPHSAFLYAKHRETRIQSHAMARGEVFHEFAEWHSKECLETGDTYIPPDVGREQIENICDQRPDLVVPHHERDALRAMAWNYCAATNVDPAMPPRTEIDAEMQLDGWVLRGRLDWVVEKGNEVWIKDYKTSLAMRSQEDFEQSFQVYLYALMWLDMNPNIDHFHVAEEYPRFLSHRCTACGSWCDGHKEECECGSASFDPPSLAKRRITLGKRGLRDFERSVQSLIANLDETLDADAWPASPGSHCSTCPAQTECPLPRTHRPPVIESEEECARVLGDVDRMEADSKRLKKAARDYIKEQGEIVMGDYVYGFTDVISNKTDKEAMARALREGGADPRDFVQPTTSNRFGRKKVTAQ